MNRTGLTLLALLTVVSFAGCARFSTRQVDTTIGADGKPSREIVTRASAFTLWDSKSQLANWKAAQTDKSQTASVGSLIQEANSSTNITAIVEAVVRGAVSAVK
jgi:hypothetical protein